MPTNAVDTDLVKGEREDGKTAFHGERGSEVSAPLDKRFSTQIVHAQQPLPRDARTYREALEKLAIEHVLNGKQLPNGVSEAVSPTSGLGRYFIRQVQNMPVTGEGSLASLLDEAGIEYPKSVDELPSVTEGTRPTPIRTMDPVSEGEVEKLVDPTTYAQIKKAKAGQQVSPVPERQFATMLAQTRTPQEQYDRALDTLFYSDSDRMRRAALEHIWERLQTEKAGSASPADELSGINGDTPKARHRNLMDYIYRQGSPGAMEGVSPYRREMAEQLAWDHYFTDHGKLYRSEQIDPDAEMKEYPVRKGPAVEPQEEGLPPGLAGDARAESRVQASPSGEKLATATGSLDSPRLKQQDAARIKAREKAEAEAIAAGRTPGTIREYGTDVTPSMSYEQIRQMYLREFGQNPGAPEGVPKGFRYNRQSDTWEPAPSHLWQQRSLKYLNEPGDHLTALAEGTATPEQVQAAFDDVLKAGQERERAKNEAQAYANDVIPRAAGSAARLGEEAAAYKARIVAQAQGDAGRFSSLFTEYQKAPQVTRDRLYIESMQQIYSNVTKVLVDSRQGSNLLYLPLDKIMQNVSQGGAAAATTPEAPPASASSSIPSSTTQAFPIDPRARDTSRTRDREVR